jgi:hypothetical protein
LSWDGVRVPAIAAALGCSPKAVRERLARFAADGLDGLGDRPGAGLGRLHGGGRLHVGSVSARLGPRFISQHEKTHAVLRRRDRMQRADKHCHRPSLWRLSVHYYFSPRPPLLRRVP